MPKATIDRLKRAFRYEPETGHLIRIESIKKARFKVGAIMGTPNFEGYLTVAVDREKILAHRIAWALHYGEWPARQIDHVNRSRIDNRIDNLRLASHSENQANTIPRSACGKKGVTQLPHGSWQAQIKAKGVVHYLGSFPSADEAAHAYNKAAIKNHGEFAVLNPIGSDYE